MRTMAMSFAFAGFFCHLGGMPSGCAFWFMMSLMVLAGAAQEAK